MPAPFPLVVVARPVAIPPPLLIRVVFSISGIPSPHRGRTPSLNRGGKLLGYRRFLVVAIEHGWDLRVKDVQYHTRGQFEVMCTWFVVKTGREPLDRSCERCLARFCLLLPSAGRPGNLLLRIFNRIERAVSDKFDMAVAWFVLITIIYFSTE